MSLNFTMAVRMRRPSHAVTLTLLGDGSIAQLTHQLRRAVGRMAVDDDDPTHRGDTPEPVGGVDILVREATLQLQCRECMMIEGKRYNCRRWLT